MCVCVCARACACVHACRVSNRDLALLFPWMSWGFIAVKRHRDHRNSYNGKHLIGVGLQFRGLVNYHHGEKNGDMQAHMVLER